MVVLIFCYRGCQRIGEIIFVSSFNRHTSFPFLYATQVGVVSRLAFSRAGDMVFPFALHNTSHNFSMGLNLQNGWKTLQKVFVLDSPDNRCSQNCTKQKRFAASGTTRTLGNTSFCKSSSSSHIHRCCTAMRVPFHVRLTSCSSLNFLNEHFFEVLTFFVFHVLHLRISCCVSS